jgi:regulator of RNase E activity RraA
MTAKSLQQLVSRFRAVTTASVADAVDRVLKRPGFMSYEIKPILSANIVGPAVTVLEGPTTESRPPTHALHALDEAEPGSIIVIGMEDPQASRNVAVWGGLMTTAAVTRKLGGAVLDAGVRDVEEIRGLGFPVFSRTVVPSTTVGRYASVAKDLPVICGGVLVHPGDLLVADADGVVVVPHAQATEVLDVAEQIEGAERRMVEEIKRTGSILKALESFARI